MDSDSRENKTHPTSMVIPPLGKLASANAFMKKWMTLLIFFVCFQIVAPLFAQGAATFKIGIYQNEPKIYLNEEGNPAGLWVYLLEYIAEKESWQLKYVSGTWQECLQRLRAAEIDMLPDMAYSEKRARVFQFNQETVLSNWARIYTHPSINIETIEELQGKRIAALEGDISLERFKQFNIPCEFVLCDNYESVFQAIANEKADAGIISRFYGLLKESQYPAKRTSIVLAPMELRFAFAPNFPIEYADAIDHRLKILKKDPHSFYYHTFEKWLNNKQVKFFIPREMKIILTVAISLTLLFVLFSLLLRQKLAAKRKELKRRNEELARSERNYRMHFENAMDVIYSIDSEFRILDISPSVERILGYQPVELLGKPFLDLNLVAPEDLERAVSDTMRVLEGEEIGPHVYAMIGKNGKRVFTEINSRLVAKENGNIILVSTARDVTDRKHAENKLRQSEQYIRTILDYLPIGIAVNSVDPSVEFEYMNDLFPKFYRTKKEAIMQKDSFWEAVYENPEYREKIKQRVLDDTGSGDPARMHWEDIPIERAGYETTYISAQNIPMPETQLVISTVLDVTHRKNIETDLARQKEILSAINAVLVQSLAAENQQEVGEICLSAAEEITGSAFGFIGKVNDFSRFDKIAQSEISFASCGMPNSDKDGKRKGMEISSFWGRTIKKGRSQIINEPEQDPDRRGVPEGHPPIHTFMGVPLLRGDEAFGMIALANKPEGYDLFDQKAVEKLSMAFIPALDRIRALEALKDYSNNLEKKVEERTQELAVANLSAQATLNRLNAILLSVADGLVVTNHKAKIVLMNPAAEALLGFRFAEKKGQAIYWAIEDHTLKDRLFIALEEREPGYQFDFEIPGELTDRKRILRAKTARITTEAKNSDYPEAQNNDSMVIIISDVTSERELDRMKTEFLSTAAHELRTPLTSIQGFSEILMTRNNLEPERQKKYLSYISAQASSLGKIINDLLDISRIESGKGFSLYKKSFDLTEMIKSSVELFQSYSSKHRFEMQFEDCSLVVYADPEKLKQAVENLISNAVKYSPNGGKIQVAVQRNKENDGVDAKKKDMPFPTVTIVVKDMGLGMTPEQVKKIYEKFWRADASNKAIEGTGLGMSIVKYIVESHEGEVQVESDYGKGTIVKIRLPQKEGCS